MMTKFDRVLEPIAIVFGIFALTLVLLGFGFTACAPTQADGGAYAQEIAGPGGGVRCFAVFDSSGKAVGGNCAKVD
jgi:hypothetical protein